MIAIIIENTIQIKKIHVFFTQEKNGNFVEILCVLMVPTRSVIGFG